MAANFTWIHLSDLHCRTSTKWESDRIVQSLFVDLKDLIQSHQLNVDAIFFTGDAAFGADEGETLDAQYEFFSSFLDSVRDCCNPQLPKSAVYIVPGNHDLDRGEVLQSDTDWLRLDSRELNAITKEIRTNSKMSQQWLKRMESYRKFIKRYGLAHLEPEKPVLNWSSQVCSPAGKVFVAGFNSAWSCASSNEKGRLWMAGEWQIGDLLQKDDAPDIRIALIHHPPNWLTEYEDPQVGRRLRQEFHIVLHGHEHKNFVSRDPSGCLSVSAGACYNRGDHEKAYSVGTIDPKTREGRIYLRSWDETGGGWVAKNIAHLAPDGVYKFTQKTECHDQAVQAAMSLQNVQHESIILLDSKPSEETIRRQLAKLRRRPLSFQPQHSRIRTTERLRFEGNLGNNKIGWLVADWQMGKEGFLASAFNSIGAADALEHIYRLDCGGCNDVEEIFDDAGAHLGVTFVEFATMAAHLPQAALILEDLPSSISKSTDQLYGLIHKLKSTLDFCPSMRVVVSLRNATKEIAAFDPVILKPLDGAELIRYLQAHPDGKELLRHSDRFEELINYTGGLPSSIDRLIEKSKILALDALLDDHTANLERCALQSVPKSLIHTVEQVFNAKSEDEKRKLTLLKLLTVLRDGETFDGLKRAFKHKPFKQDHVISLADDGLIESLPVNTENGLLPLRLRNSHSGQISGDRLLRIPRQVRDYVETLIPKQEKANLYNSVSEALFGERWYQGKIKLRRAIILAYRDSTVAGPRNELLVAQYLLRSAIERGNTERIQRYARLAVNYCSELISQDRFRDAMVASRAILTLLDSELHKESWIDCAYAFGRAARMTNCYSGCIEILGRLLEVGQIKTKSLLMQIHMNMAWSYESLHNPEKAKFAAQGCLNLADKESEYWFHATALMMQLEYGYRIPYLDFQALWLRARNLGHTVATNNIAIDLSKKCGQSAEALRILDDVIQTARDRYTQTRAIVDKGKKLNELNQIANLSDDDQWRLAQAYEYSCAQRIGGLLDSCHEVLWEFCTQKRLFAGLFRLFRFTSFVWCLDNKGKNEKRYLSLLRPIRTNASVVNDLEIDIEVEYFDRRISGNSEAV